MTAPRLRQRRMRLLKWAAAVELAFGILVTPFFTNLLVSVVHISLALTWLLVVVGQRAMIKVGWVDDPRAHDRCRLTSKERDSFATLVEHYDEEAQH